MYKKHLKSVALSALVKQLYETKNEKRNNMLVNVIKSGLSDLKDEIKTMSEDEKKLNNQLKY